MDHFTIDRDLATILGERLDALDRRQLQHFVHLQILSFELNEARTISTCLIGARHLQTMVHLVEHLVGQLRLRSQL